MSFAGDKDCSRGRSSKSIIIAYQLAQMVMSQYVNWNESEHTDKDGSLG